MTIDSKTQPYTERFASRVSQLLGLLALSMMVLGCISGEEQLGHSQEAIIECNGGSVGQACDTDDDLCTEEVCIQEGQSVYCQLQALAVDGTACLSDNLPCTADSCQAGVCNHLPLVAGTLCNDGLFCTLGDFCSEAGICGGGAPTCDDANQCTADSCDELANSCDNSATPGSPCDDGDACTESESCDNSGQCSDATQVTCDDGSSCTSDSCDPGQGCVFDITPDISCGDSFFCTVGEICTDDGSCQGTANCDDSNPCTLDSCDELAANCSNLVAPGLSCNDGNECTSTDLCDALGDCSGSPLPDGSSCGASGGCLIGGMCENGNCVNATPQPDNTPCDDNDACTLSEACVSGICDGYPINCSDGDPCTADGCDSQTGCFNEFIEGCQMGGDAGTPDAGLPDAGLSDAGSSDAGSPDAGSSPDAAEGVLGGGGCNTGASESGNSSLLILLGLSLLLIRKRRFRNILLLLPFVVLLGASPKAYADGFDSELFKPATSSTSFFSQSSAETLPSMSYHLNMGFHLSTSPLVLRDAQSGAELPGGTIVSQRSGAYLSAGLGLWDRYELGIAMPMVLLQEGSGMMLSGNPDLSSASLGDMRIEAKARLWSSSSTAVAVQVGTTLPLGDKDALFGESDPTLVSRIILSTRKGPVHLGFNLGMRLRGAAEVAALPVDDELTAGAGVELEVLPGKFSLLAEVYANRAMHTSKSEASPAESIAGLRYQVQGPWQLQAGLGAGLGAGYGTPAYRALVSFSYAPVKTQPAIRPIVAELVPPPKKVVPKAKVEEPEPEPKPTDEDGDGIFSPTDECPTEAEDFDEFEDEDGCPDLDNDGDTIADSEDKCPMQPETVNGVEDEDGCPDEGIIEMTYDRIVLDDTVLFDPNRARVKRRGKKALRAIVSLYAQHPEWGSITINGHSDSHGPRDYNLELSRRRAERVREELIKLGIEAGKVSSEGFGETKLLRRDKSERASQRNRRVEFIIEVNAKKPPTPVSEPQNESN